MTIQQQIDALKPWHQKIDFGGGAVSPGKWDATTQARDIAGWIPGGVTGKSIIDVGSNAGGVGFELASMGAGNVTMLERTKLYHDQAKLFAAHHDIPNAMPVHGSAFDVHTLPAADIVLWLGLVYHFRHPQLFLDYAASCPGSFHVLSTQTIGGDTLNMRNRKVVYPDQAKPALGWEPTKPMFTAMLETAGYRVIEIYDRSGPEWTNKLYAMCEPPAEKLVDQTASATILNRSNAWS